jgi:elongation factor G
MDKLGADFFRSFDSIRARLRSNPVAIQIPIGAEGDFDGLIDLVTMKAIHFKAETLGKDFVVGEIPAAMRDEAELYHHEMIEKLAEVDEPIMELFAEDKPVDEAMIRRGIRAATVSGAIQPVLLGSALKYQGVQQLLDAAVHYLPSPLDVSAVQGRDMKDREKVLSRECDPDAPLSALVFKIISEQHGDLCFIRVYSGTLKTSSRVFNPDRKCKENITRIWRMHAKERYKEDEVQAGDIVAVTGLKDSFTGDTLCDAKEPIVLEHIEFPETVINMAIEPMTSADKDRLAAALISLKREDPTFHSRMDGETGQTIISGMGELHLEIIKNRIQRDMRIDVRVGKPRVSYRETITVVSEAESRFIRQMGNKNQFAVITLRLEPHTPQADQPSILVVNQIPEEDVREEFVDAAMRGVKDALTSGVLLGYPVLNVKATLLSGEEHPTDSSEISFESAATLAVHEALSKAHPILLEPIMKLEVTTPDDYFGSVTGDLTSRRAMIIASTQQGDVRRLVARVPLAEMFGYATQVRSISQGRANPTDFEPCGYEAVPADVAKKILDSGY